MWIADPTREAPEVSLSQTGPTANLRVCLATGIVFVSIPPIAYFSCNCNYQTTVTTRTEEWL